MSEPHRRQLQRGVQFGKQRLDHRGMLVILPAGNRIQVVANELAVHRAGSQRFDCRQNRRVVDSVTIAARESFVLRGASTGLR